MKQKILFIAPHLSTGGMPQYLLKQIQAVQDDFEVFCIEWQDVVNWLVERGYEVKLLSKEHDGYMGNYNPTGVTQHPESTIESVIEQLKMSKLFIGISSGLSWLSWAVGTPTVIVSGFSEPYAEMKECVRITAPKMSCSGCFNRARLDPNDWHWCPDHKNTPRQYECSRNITSEMVIKELENSYNFI